MRALARTLRDKTNSQNILLNCNKLNGIHNHNNEEISSVKGLC